MCIRDSFLVTAEQGISAGTRRVEALTGEAAITRAREDQSILEELEASAKTDRKGLVDEYAKMREKIRALERERDQLKMMLATGGTGSASSAVQAVGGVQVWAPRFGGLER